MKADEWVRHDSGDFSQSRDDDIGEEAERREGREMADPIWLPEDLEAPEGEGVHPASPQSSEDCP